MFRGSLKNRSGVTSSVANQWSQVAPENPSRMYLLIQNISDTPITVGVGQPTAEFAFVELSSNGIYSASGFVTTQRLVVKSTGTSKAYFACEA